MNPPPRNPNPIISRGKPTFSSPAGGSQLVEGRYHNGGWNAGTAPSPTAPAWAAINLGAGPTRVLVSWDDGGTYNYKDPAGTIVYGYPDSYEIDLDPRAVELRATVEARYLLAP